MSPSTTRSQEGITLSRVTGAGGAEGFAARDATIVVTATLPPRVKAQESPALSE